METQQPIGFYQVMQQHVDGYLQHVNLTSKDVIRYVSVFGLGFLFGILLKRYGAQIISWLIGVVLVISVLNYFDLVIIQKANIKVLLHLDHIHCLDDMIVEIKTQVHQYVIESCVFVVAVMLGFKLG